MKFRRLARRFLRARWWKRLETAAIALMDDVAGHHEKASDIKPLVEELRLGERFGNMAYKERRLHVAHQSNVFLLGLLLYDMSPKVRDKISISLDTLATPVRIPGLNSGQDWKFSGGTEFGEFLYQWRLASIVHDVGNVVGGYKLGQPEILEGLNRALDHRKVSLASIDELWNFSGGGALPKANLLKKMNGAIPEIDFEQLWKDLVKKPLFGAISYDHGIASALLFLRAMHELFSDHNPTDITKIGSSRVVWHPSLLNTSILQIAVAVALHNVDQLLENGYIKWSKPQHEIYSIDHRPIAWLLKVADTLQEWDKPKQKTNRPWHLVKWTRISLRMKGDKIQVCGFRAAKAKTIRTKLQKYTACDDYIEIV